TSLFPLARAASPPESVRGKRGRNGAWGGRTRLGSLHVLSEALAHLVDLRHGDRETVALSGVLGEKVLVVLLRRIEIAQRGDLRDDLTVPPLGRPRAGGLEEIALGLVCVVHRGAVLRADVVALAV